MKINNYKYGDQAMVNGTKRRARNIHMTTEGIPLLPCKWQEGSPREGHLLNTDSPQTSLAGNLEKPSDNVNKISMCSSKEQYRENILANLQNFPINNDCVMGIDIGVSSVGIAVIGEKSIKHVSVRLFDPDDFSYLGESRRVQRSRARANRRYLRRRRNRLAGARRFLKSAGLPDPCLVTAEVDRYQARVDGLNRRLTGAEFSAALYALCKRRGLPVASSPVDDGLSSHVSGGGDDSPISLDWRSSQYRTIGEMLALDGFWSVGKRNKQAQHWGTLSRALVRSEAQALIESQWRFGRAEASFEFQVRYLNLAFASKDLQDFGSFVGKCPFIPANVRAARRAPSVERMHFLAALSKIKLRDGAEIRRLSHSEIQRLLDEFGLSPSISRNFIRRVLNFPETVRFPQGTDLDRDLDTSDNSHSTVVPS
jgi:hypothetical protein